MFRLTSLATALLSLFMLSAPASAYEAITGPLGLLAYDKAKAYDGYTLFTPHTKVSSWIVDKIQDPGSRKTYLIDMEGNIVHTWKHDHPAFYAELLPNGNLLRAEKIAGSPVNFGGWYGLLREYAWDGKVVWEYKVSNPRQIAHHGFDRLPNGNTAILIWENKTYDEALAKGRDPKDKALSRNGMPAPGQGPDGQPLQGIWPDAILEVTPKGEIAWEWHVWDNIGTGPDQIDINWHLPLSMGYFARADWTHWNSVRYNAKTDQYAVNSRDFGEIYIIDRKTKKIVWRYGNPATHGMGKAPSGYHDDGDQVLFGSHDVEWLPNGNISIFNNGTHRPSANRSSVMEINPATNQVVWQYETKDHNSFYSDFQSAAQKLPNGNWFITSTNNGHLFEVTPDKQVVWEYNNPISTDDQAYCVKRDDNPITFAAPPIGIILLYFIAGKVRKSNKVTVPEIMGARYGKAASIIAALCVMLAYVGVLATQLKAAADIIVLLCASSGIEISHGLALTICTALIAIITVGGGLVSVAYSDAISALLMIGGFFLAIPFLIGVANSQGATLPPEKMTITGGMSGWELLGYFLPSLALMLGDQNMLQRFASAKNSDEAKKSNIGMFIGEILVIISIVLVVTQAAKLYPTLDVPSNVIFQVAVDYLPLAFGALVMCACMAFIVTTADSYLLSSATNLTNDIYVKYIRKDATDKQKMLVLRGTIIVFSFIAVALTLYFPTVLSLQMTAYTMYGAAITPAILFALFSKKVTPAGGMAGILVGGLVTIIWTLMGTPYGIQCAIVAVPASVIAILIVSAVTRCNDPKRSLEALYQDN